MHSFFIEDVTLKFERLFNGPLSIDLIFWDGLVLGWEVIVKAYSSIIWYTSLLVWHELVMDIKGGIKFIAGVFYYLKLVVCSSISSTFVIELSYLLYLLLTHSETFRHLLWGYSFNCVMKLFLKVLRIKGIHLIYHRWTPPSSI